MSAPRVSVVLTTYRRPDYLRQSLASVLAQTCGEFELVVAEDGGPAYAEAQVAALADPRVRCLRNPETLGVVANVRRAVAATRAPLVTILNDDDLWEPELLASLVPPLEADPQLALAFGDHWIIGPAGAIDPAETEANTVRWRRDRLTPGVHRPFAELALLVQAVPTVMACVLRRAVVAWEELPAEAAGHYDLFLAYLAAREGGGAHYVPCRLSRYRVHPQAETSLGRLSNYAAAVFCYQRFLSDPRLTGIRPGLRARWLEKLAGYGLQLLRHGDAARARHVLARAWREEPSGRVGAGLALAYLPGPARTPLLNGLSRLARRARALRARSP